MCITPTTIDDERDEHRFAVVHTPGKGLISVYDRLARRVVHTTDATEQAAFVAQACRDLARHGVELEDPGTEHLRSLWRLVTLEPRVAARILWERDDDEALAAVVRVAGCVRARCAASVYAQNGMTLGSERCERTFARLYAKLPLWAQKER